MVHFTGMPDKIVLRTVSEALRNAEVRLRPKKIRCVADVDEGRLDAEVLLSFILKKDRAWIVAHGNDRLSGNLRLRFEKLVARREEREPVAYITGHKEFYGRDFIVSPATLIPRPDTELIIDVLRSKYKKGDSFLLADIGTGCGAIAISAALEFTKATVIATDISSAALAVAAKNAKRFKVARRVTFVKGDLLSQKVIDVITRVNKTPLILAANLPYLPDRDMKKMDRDVVDYEPHEALFSGKDGLDDIRRFFDQIENDYPTNPDLILVEFDPPQAKALKQLAKETFPLMKAVIHNDLAGRNRVIAIDE
jgi:release factor glutamine methyltransferase